MSNNNLKCEPCNKTFTRNYNYKRHIESKLHKSNINLKENVEIIKQDNNIFSDTTISESETTTQQKIIKKYFCDYCSYITDVKCNYFKHIKIHGKKTFCELCKIKYNNAYDHNGSRFHTLTYIDKATPLLWGFQAKKVQFMNFKTTIHNMKKRNFITVQKEYIKYIIEETQKL